ncbi:hypothetical protein BSKO_01844 [Bryopsis sp. KO-2023]|nr:hypothetical protein BSKO_01844 [Bryopsis sp. KO-2023]
MLLQSCALQQSVSQKLAANPLSVRGPRAIRRTPQCSARKDDTKESSPVEDPLHSVALGASALTAPFLLSVGDAMAKGGEYGLLEGRTLALIHPAVMITLFGTTCYAGYLGWQWRSLREVSADLKDLKKRLPAKGEDGERPASPLDAEVKELETIRKDLSGGNFRDRHYNIGTVLLGGGVSIAVFGCLNTYLRTGKLFPGPHLFAGAGIVVLWALAASLVPAMQKGNDTARTAHIGLNTLNVLLFAWQIPTGFDIVNKVFEFTTWP